MDPERPYAGAVAVSGERIAWVGDLHQAESDLANVKRRVDLGGATLIPGFNDAHHHLMLLGHWLSQIDCSYPAVKSIDDIKAAVAQVTKQTPAGEWIEGRGYDDNKLAEKRHPNRWDLDAVAPHHPVRIRNVSGHMSVVNTQALQLAGITKATEAPFGGAIHIDLARGEPSGLLQEQAQNLIPRPFVPEDKDALRRSLEEGSRAYLAAGVTSSQEAGIFSALEFTVFQEAWSSRTLPLRTYMMIRVNFLDALEQVGFFTGFGDNRLRVGALKLLADGSLIGRTAAVSQPFLEDPRPDNLGLEMYPQEELDELVWRGHRAGWQVAIHAIGDRAIEMCLNSYEQAQRRKPRLDARHRIEHCGINRPDLIRRMKELGVIPVPQPPFIIEFGDGFLRHLGRERCQLTYPLRSFLDAGLPVAGSSDSPVSSYEPLFGIKAAVTEMTASGVEYAPRERLTVEEAIAIYTRAGAYASFDERRKGTITPGKLADFAVLDSDPRRVEPAAIDQVRVLATYVGGEAAYEAPIAGTRAQQIIKS
ncbi:MAG TPA: amidohydrolase [Candidatus Dormibacteraeota bacterium]|nr:amidohydrolase [Candidatus Dormibacteraeota bacterium]